MATEKRNVKTVSRSQLVAAERSTRELIEHFQHNVLGRAAELRELSRPVRRRSHYPTLARLVQSLRQMETTCEEALILGDFLEEDLHAAMGT